MSTPIMDNCCGCGPEWPPSSFQNLRQITAQKAWPGVLPYPAWSVGTWSQTGTAPHIEWVDGNPVYVGYVAPSDTGLAAANARTPDENEQTRYLHVKIEATGYTLYEPFPPGQETNDLFEVETVIDYDIDARDGMLISEVFTVDPDPCPYWYGSYANKTAYTKTIPDTGGTYIGSAPPFPYGSVLPGDVSSGYLVAWSCTRTATTEETTATYWVAVNYDELATYTKRCLVTLSSAYSVTAAIADAVALVEDVAWSEVPKFGCKLITYQRTASNAISLIRSAAGFAFPWAFKQVADTYPTYPIVEARKSKVQDDDNVLCDVSAQGQELMEPSTVQSPNDGHWCQAGNSDTSEDVLGGGEYEFTWTWVPTVCGDTYGNATPGTC